MKNSIFHCFAISRTLFSHITQKDKHIVAHPVQHLCRLHFLEYVPTHFIVWHILVGSRIVPHTIWKRRVKQEIAYKIGNCFLFQLFVIEHLHKEQISYLLKYRRSVGKPFVPECLPHSIPLLFYIAGYHIVIYLLSLISSVCMQRYIILRYINNILKPYSI